MALPRQFQLDLLRVHVCTRTHVQKQTDRETDRQTDRQTDKVRDRQTDRQTDRQSQRQTETETETVIETETETDTETDTQSAMPTNAGVPSQGNLEIYLAYATYDFTAKMEQRMCITHT